MIKDDSSALEQKLTNMDFYNEFADKDRMLGNLINKLNNKKHSRPVSRVFRPAIIVAVVFAIVATSGFTVFAGNIEALLKQIGFAGGVANQVEQLGDEYDTDIFAAYKVYNSDLTLARSDDAVWQWYNFDSLDEAKTAINFPLTEPVGLPDNWVLMSIKVLSDGDKSASACIELVYDDPSTNPDGKRYKSEDDIPRHTRFYVYQQFIGEGAELNIDTVEGIQNVTVNGINMLLMDSTPGDWRHGGSLVWVQGGVAISINPMQCTYDELIAFAELFTQ